MPSKSYLCVACPTQIFPSKVDLSMHNSAFHESGKIPCPQCKVVLSTIQHLKRHLKKHDPSRKGTIKCHLPLCDSFYNANEVKQHFARFHPTERPFPCPFQCGKSFKTKRNVGFHILSHTQEKLYKCDHCDSSFSRTPNLKRHLKTRHTLAGSPHQCSHCGKKFTAKASLKGHILRIHTPQIQTWHCPQCPYKCFSKGDLKIHSEIHNPDRKLVDCYFCSRKIIKGRGLERHLRTHTTEEPYFCREESRNYASAHESTAQHHVRNIHQKSQPSTRHSCYFCLTSFTNAALIIHMRIHTREEPFSCEMCRKSFNALSNRNKHIRLIHTKEKTKKCNLCEKCFGSGGDLKRHSATHTGEKRFFCDICSYSTYRSGHFKRHQKTHT